MADCDAALIYLGRSPESTIYKPKATTVLVDDTWRAADTKEALVVWDAFEKCQELLKADKVFQISLPAHDDIPDSGDLIIGRGAFAIEKRRVDGIPTCSLRPLSSRRKAGPSIPKVPTWNNPSGYVKVSAGALKEALRFVAPRKQVDVCAPYPIIAVTGEDPNLVALIAPKRFLLEEIEGLAALQNKAAD